MLKTQSKNKKAKSDREKSDFIDQILNNIDQTLDTKENTNTSHIIKNVYIVKSFGRRSVLMKSQQANRQLEIEPSISLKQLDNKPFNKEIELDKKDLSDNISNNPKEHQEEAENFYEPLKLEDLPSYKGIPKPNQMLDENYNYEHNKVYQQEFKINLKNARNKIESPPENTIEDLTNKIEAIMNEHMEKFNNLKTSYHQEIKNLLVNHSSMLNKLSIKDNEKNSTELTLKTSSSLNDLLEVSLKNCGKLIDKAMDADDPFLFNKDLEQIEKNLKSSKSIVSNNKKKFAFGGCLSPIDEEQHYQSKKI